LLAKKLKDKPFLKGKLSTGTDFIMLLAQCSKGCIKAKAQGLIGFIGYRVIITVGIMLFYFYRVLTINSFFGISVKHVPAME